MTARQLLAGGHWFSVSGEGYSVSGAIRPDHEDDAADLERLLTGCAFCNLAAVSDGAAVGDPTEAGLVVLAIKGGVDVLGERTRRPRVGEVPFDSNTKLMATFHDAGDFIDGYVKGAPDVLLTRCTSLASGDGTRAPLDAASLDAALAANDALGERGLRVLAVASTRIASSCSHETTNARAHIDQLCFEGLVGLADPPRPGARLAIERCRVAGINVKMISGAHAVTARTIATELGITGEVLTGRELDQLTGDEPRFSLRRDWRVRPRRSRT